MHGRQDSEVERPHTVHEQGLKYDYVSFTVMFIELRVQVEVAEDTK